MSDKTTETVKRGVGLRNEVMPPASRHNLDETLAHIRTVQRFLAHFAAELTARAIEHDATKLQEPEFSVFTEVTPKLRGLTYGSDEYKAQLKELGVALTHHYANNRHHPEHHDRGIDDMNLFDLCEMFCDWLAATQRHDDGNIYRSIEINRERFGMAEQLAHILHNTAVALEA